MADVKKTVKQIPLFSAQDIFDIATFAVLAVPAWILPLTTLWRVVFPLAYIHAQIRRPVRRVQSEAVRRTSFEGSTFEFAVRRLQFSYHETILQLRLLIRPTTQLRLRLEGLENIDRELAHGRGVILLIGTVSYSEYVAKAALAQSGIALIHLSIPGHGSSGTKFGRRFVTKFRTAVENRYLRERIVMSAENPINPLKTLRNRLRENCAVTITAVPAVSSIAISCIGGETHLGRAAPSLSRTSGASVLPVFTYSENSTDFVVRVGQPLQASGKGVQFEQSLAQDFGAVLEGYVRKHPARWKGWGGWDDSDNSRSPEASQ